MVPEFNLALAQQRAAELRREAEAYRRARAAADGRPISRPWWWRARRVVPVSRPAIRSS